MAQIAQNPPTAVSFKKTYANWRYRIGLDPVSYIFRLLILVFFVIFFGVPVLWLFITPTKAHKQLTELPALAIGGWQNVLDSWQRLMDYNNGIVLTWAWNSVWYVAIALTLCLVITIPAGYLLANVDIKGRKVLLWATLILMLLPSDAAVLPMYMELYLLRLINSPWAVILPAGFAPFAVYLTYTYYKTVMPRDIVDAAKVDGCSDLAMFWHIGLPLAQSIIAMLLFTQFATLWNGFFAASIFLESDRLKTLPVGIWVMAQQTGALNPNPSAYGKVLLLRPDMATISVITVLPVILIFLVSQRFIVRAATAGAIQGE
ncbi:MAG: carbohydrate ABC transporter permease [Chloroflexota bacterium]|nr:carbohydrate ABC transporter permease [Chloroflexota bacterium]